MKKLTKGMKSIFYCLLLELRLFAANVSHLFARHKAKTTHLNVAVHIHLFYPELTGHFLRLLKNIPCSFKLFITVCEENSVSKEKFKKTYPDCVYCIVPNKGRDLGAFIYALNEFNLEEYDLIIKLHSKSNRGQNLISPWLINNHQVLNRRYWRNSMEYALIGSRKKASNLLTAFLSGNVGLAGAKRFLTEDSKNTNEKETAAVFALCDKMNLNRKIAFFAGTIFAVKGEILTPLKTLSINDFKSINESSENTSLEYCLERIFGSLAISKNYEIKCI